MSLTISGSRKILILVGCLSPHPMPNILLTQPTPLPSLPQQAVPVQEPTEHWSLQVVGLPSLQAVPSGLQPLAGQPGPVPVQLSATSQTPAAGRQTVPAALKLLAGQVVFTPSQTSATSQAAPKLGRHSVPV